MGPEGEEKDGQAGSGLPCRGGRHSSRATDPRQLEVREVMAMEKTHFAWVGVCLEVLRS